MFLLKREFLLRHMIVFLHFFWTINWVLEFGFLVFSGSWMLSWLPSCSISSSSSTSREKVLSSLIWFLGFYLFNLFLFYGSDCSRWRGEFLFNCMFVSLLLFLIFYDELNFWPLDCHHMYAWILLLLFSTSKNLSQDVFFGILDDETQGFGFDITCMLGIYKKFLLRCMVVFFHFFLDLCWQIEFQGLGLSSHVYLDFLVFLELEWWIRSL